MENTYVWLDSEMTKISLHDGIALYRMSSSNLGNYLDLSRIAALPFSLNV